jgi:FkbM family methyltransferase
MEKNEIYATLNRAYFSDEPHEKDVINHLPELLRGVKLVADVGASLGQYTRAMITILNDAEIHAIEADPIRAEELQRNCETWRVGSRNRVFAHHLALADKTGTVSYFATNTNVSGGLEPRPGSEEIEVSCSTLDDLFPVKAPDFVKIDVEGAELAVLKGAQRVLATGPVLLIELHGPTQAREVRSLLRGYGYRSAVFFGQPVFTRSLGLWLKLTPRGLWQRVLGAIKRRL